MLKTIHHRVIIKLSFLGALRSSLFQLLILALSGSIFSLYDIKQKTKKVRGFNNEFSKFYKKSFGNNFRNFEYP